MDKTFDWLNPFASVALGISARADGIKQWAISNRELIQPTKRFLESMIVKVEAALQAVPPVVMLSILVLIAWQAAGRRVAIVVFFCLMILGFLSPEAWGLAMTTLAIVAASVVACAATVAITAPLAFAPAGRSPKPRTEIRWSRRLPASRSATPRQTSAVEARPGISSTSAPRPRVVTEIRRELKAVWACAPDPALQSRAPPTSTRRMFRLCSMPASG